MPRRTKQNARTAARRPSAEDDHPSLGWRIAGLAGRVVVPVLLLLLLAGGAAYVRMLNGPISLKFLAAPIARSMSSELGDFTLTIEDAIARLTPAGDVEFRLRDVRLLDAEQQPVAEAPLAAFSLSGEALWEGRLTPERIVLIEPKALVVLGRGPGPNEPTVNAPGATNTAPPAAAAPAGTPAADAPDNLAKMDLLRVIARASSPSGPKQTNYLKQLGFRQATVILDSGGRRSAYRVTDGDIDLESWRRESVAIARFSFASSRGPWSITARVEESQDRRTLTLAAQVQGLVPAAALPPDQGGFLAALTTPVSVDLKADISPDGNVQRAAARIDLGTGQILTDAAKGQGIPFEKGRIALGYDAANRRFDISPSSLSFDGKHIDFIGAIAAENATPGSSWRFALRTQQGIAAAATGPAIPIDQLDIDGRWDGKDGSLDVTRALLRSNGSEAVFTARFPGSDSQGYRVEGRTPGLSVETLRVFWPRGVAPKTRDWIAANIKQGRLSTATLKVDGIPALARVGRVSTSRVSLAAEAADVVLQPVVGWPAIEVPRALIRLDEPALEISVPEAALGPPARRLALRQGRFVVRDVMADFPQGELTLRTQGPFAAALSVLDGDSRVISKELGTSFDGIEGKVDGQLALMIPLDTDASFRDIQISGKARVTEGRARGLLGGMDAQGVSLAVDISNEAVDVQGDLLLQGVAAKLSAQHLLRAGGDVQPPIRITANLDAADRNQLGIDINHMVTGDIPIEIIVARAGGELQTKVQGNLTSAELAIESLGWRKPPGRPATLQFDIAKGAKYKTELQGFRLSGEDIAISGWIGIDANSKLREVQFSDFILNVISRLEVGATLRNDNVWDMRVKGATFDGRNFFRTLLTVGRAVEPAPGSRTANRPGLDLRADIDNVLGHGEVALKGLRLQLSRRNDKLVALQARGVLDGGKPLEVTVQAIGSGDPRRLIATSDDAGQFFKLVGFYPNAQNGRMRLTVDLEGKGPVEKTGLLEVAGFRILGDPVVYEVIASPGGSAPEGRRESRTVRQAIDFDSMRAPFSIGQGQFVLEDADLRGPLFGAILRGKVDFKSQTLQLGGTYVPLQALNSAIGAIPGLGQLLAGPRGEGVLGITFAIQGPMAQPQVIVNPLSLVAPGIFREMFQMTNPSPKVTPRTDTPPVRSGQPSQSASPPRATPNRPPASPQTLDGWRSETQQRPQTQ